MKITTFAGIQKSIDKLDLYDIKNTSDLYSYYIRKNFEKCGVETRFGNFYSGHSNEEILKTIKVNNADHTLSFAQRGFSVRIEVYPLLKNLLRYNIRGKITSICDHVVRNPIEDLIFYAIPKKEIVKNNKYVAWACDHDILYPEKDNSVFRILIDHAYYKKGNEFDLSESIAKQCLEFKKIYKDKSVLIRRFSGENGVETVDESNYKYTMYNRKTSMPYPKACEEYRKADIFIVAHKEGMGLSVLESAASGALVVSPTEYIKQSLMKDLNHTYFNGTLPWELIFQKINVEQSVESTKKYNWEITAQRMLEEFK